MSVMVRIMIAFASGSMLALVFPTWNFSILVWVWMLPLLPLIWSGEKLRHGFAFAYCAGLAFWMINLKWIWTVSGIGAIALAAFLALYFGFWGMIAVSVGNPWKKRDKSNNSKKSSIQKRIEGKLAEENANATTRSKTAGGVSKAWADARRSLGYAFINAAAWVGFEWLRGWVFTGFGWNGLGVAFHDTPVLAQAADIVGVTGLAFTPVFMSAVLVQTIRRMAGEVKEGKLRPKIDFGFAVLLIALQFCYGIWRMKEVNRWETQPLRVVLIQQNIPQDLKWDEGAARTIMDDYAESTRHAMAKLELRNEKLMLDAGDGEVELLQPDLVIWPESSIAYPAMFVEGDPHKYFYEHVGALLDDEVRPLGGFTLLAGMNEMEMMVQDDALMPRDEGKTYNSIVAISPDLPLNKAAQSYRKSHLVIFGEYIPYKDEIPFLADLFAFSAGSSFAGNMNAGTSTEPTKLTSAAGEFEMIPSVCFEDSVGRLTRKFVTAKPQVIINLTNDGWFKESEAAEVHMANARFRAIELRRPMIRCANTGVSAIISTTGVLADSATGERQVIEDETGNHFVKQSLYGVARLPVSGPVSFYALASDSFSWLMMLSVGMITIYRCFKKG